MLIFIETFTENVIIFVIYACIHKDANIFAFGNTGHNFLSAICCFGTVVMRLNINRDYTPTHRMTGDKLNEIIDLIISHALMGEKHLKELGVLDFIYGLGLIFVFIAVLIYNEVVVLKIFGFDRDTKEEVRKRDSEEGLEMVNDMHFHQMYDDK